MRIGLILPSGNVTTEPEMWRIAPEGVSLHSSRMLASGCGPEELHEMDRALERCADELNSIEPDVIFYGCTSSSFFNGIGWERELRQRIWQRAPGAVALTAAGAVLEAMEAFGAQRITILSPYVEEVARIGTNFFQSVGYEVVSEAHMGCRLIRDICRISFERILESCLETVRKDTQLVFISCTNLPTLHIIPQLEEILGIPVISSNQAGMWAALRAGSAAVQDRRFGQLFQLV